MPIGLTPFFRIKNFCFILINIGLLLISSTLYAQVIRSFKYENIGQQLQYFEDKNANLPLQHIQQLKDSDFSTSKFEIPNFGNTKSAWWLKIRYYSQAKLPIYLIIDAPNIEHIVVYTSDEAGKMEKIETGSLVKTNNKVIISNNFMMSLPIWQESAEKTIFIRLKTNNILLAPIKLATAENIIAQEPARIGIEYIYIGLLIGFLLFNLFLFISLKDNTYFYYVLYVFTLSSYILLYLRGFSFVFGDEFRILFSTYPHTFMGGSLIALLAFSSNFLNLKETAPKMRKFFYAFGILGVALFFTSILGLKSASAIFTQFFSFITALVMCLAGIISYRNGHKPAKYFVLAWLIILVATIVVTCSLGGLIPLNEFIVQLVPLSTIIELLLLSFALGDRYKIILQTEKELRDENLHLIKTQNFRLEESVNERTQQLSRTIIELEESNTVKNKLFSIIAHDLRSPLSSLMGILTLNDMNALSLNELRKLLDENKKTVDSINNTLNNLLHWAQGQMNGMATQTVTFNLTSLVNELTLSYLPLIKKKEINVDMPSDLPYLVAADKNQITLVLRNLIDNAIKFTPLRGHLKLTLSSINNEVVCGIENEVANNHEINLDNLQGKKIATATMGTQNERGVGLGLLLCNEYIKNNGGVLQVKLIDHKVRFSFTLRPD